MAREITRLTAVTERQAATINALLVQTQRNGDQASRDVEQQTRRLTNRSTTL